LANWHWLLDLFWQGMACRWQRSQTIIHPVKLERGGLA
jgi:hypothetical protein